MKRIWGCNEAYRNCRKSLLPDFYQTRHLIFCWNPLQVYEKILCRTMVCCKKSSKVLAGDSRLWTQIYIGRWFQLDRILWFRNWRGQRKWGVYFWLYHESWIRICLMEITQTISSNRFHNWGIICGSSWSNKGNCVARENPRIFADETNAFNTTHDRQHFYNKVGQEPEFPW